MAYRRPCGEGARRSISVGLAARWYVRNIQARGLHLHCVIKSNMLSQQILEDKAVLVLITELLSKLQDSAFLLYSVTRCLLQRCGDAPRLLHFICRQIWL